MSNKQTLRKGIAFLMVFAICAVAVVGVLAEGPDLSQYTKKTVGTKIIYVDVNGNQFVLNSAGELIPYVPTPPTPPPARLVGPGGGARYASESENSSDDSGSGRTDRTTNRGRTTTPSGTTPSGTTTDSTTPSGTTPDSTTPGGTTPSGATTGGTTPSGATTGGTTTGGTTPSGTTTDSTTTGGTTPSGATTGGTTEGQSGSGADGDTSGRINTIEPSDEPPTPATLILSIAANPASGEPGAAVTVTVTSRITENGAAPKGVISLSSDAVTGFAEALPLVNGTAVFTGAVVQNAINGNHKITAIYSGGDYVTTAAVTATFSVTGGAQPDSATEPLTGSTDGPAASTPLTLAVATAPATGAPGDVVTVTVSGMVQAGGAAPTGTVTLSSGAFAGFGEAQPLASGSVTFTGTVAEGAVNGDQSITAIYAGEDYPNTAAASANFAVTGGADAAMMSTLMGTVERDNQNSPYSPQLPLIISTDNRSPVPGGTIAVTVSYSLPVGSTATPTGTITLSAIRGTVIAPSSVTIDQFTTEATFVVTLPATPANYQTIFTAKYTPTSTLVPYSATSKSLTVQVGGVTPPTFRSAGRVVFSPPSPAIVTSAGTVLESVYYNGELLGSGYTFSPVFPGSFATPGTYSYRVYLDGNPADFIPVTYIVTGNTAPICNISSEPSFDGRSVILRFYARSSVFPGAVVTGSVNFTGNNGFNQTVQLVNGVATVTVTGLDPNTDYVFYGTYLGNATYTGSGTLPTYVRTHKAQHPVSSVGLTLSAKMQSNNRHATLKATLSSRWWYYGPDGYQWNYNPNYYVYPDGSGYEVNGWGWQNGWFTPNNPSHSGHYNRYPTGWISFYAGNTFLGTVRLEKGEATLTWRNVPVGTHRITAVYTGDNSFYGTKATASLTRKGSSGSSSTKAKTPATTTQTASGVVLRDAANNVVQTYNTWQITPQDGILTLSTTHDYGYYSFGFPMSEFSERASSSGEFNLVAPGFNLYVPYDFVQGIQGLADFKAKNNLSDAQMELRFAVRSLDNSALSMVSNGFDASVMEGVFQVDVSLHGPDGSAYPFKPGEFTAPLQLLIGNQTGADTALFYDETAKALIPVGLSQVGNGLGITVEWNGMYALARSEK